jgi:hypothetical protein
MRRDDATRHFASDPIGTLKSIGGVFCPERRITALYRFRACCIDLEDKRGGSHTVVGLPISHLCCVGRLTLDALSSTHWESGSAAGLNSGDVLTGIN